MLVAENNMPGRPTRGNFGFLKIGRTTGPILNYEHMLKNMNYEHIPKNLSYEHIPIILNYENYLEIKI